MQQVQSELSVYTCPGRLMTYCRLTVVPTAASAVVLLLLTAPAKINLMANRQCLETSTWCCTECGCFLPTSMGRHSYRWLLVSITTLLLLVKQ